MKKDTDKTPNTILLNDTWILKKINDKSIQDKTMKHIQVEFHTQEKKFYGTDGCNNIFGNISQLGESLLEFDSMASTKMACPNMEFSDIYIQLFQKTHFYKIENLQLYLLNKNKKILLEYKKLIDFL